MATSPGAEGSTPVQSGLTTNVTLVSGLTPGQDYYFTVTASNAVGSSRPSLEAEGLGGSGIPGPLSGVTATASGSTVMLNWNPSAYATSYYVFTGTTPGGEVGTSMMQTSGTNITVTGLNAGQTYYFLVSAINDAKWTIDNESEVSVTLLPLAPAGLTTTTGDGSVTLSWSPVTGASSYNIYQGTTPGGESKTPVSTGITGTSTTITGLTSGTTYYFTVAATNIAGSSPDSGEVSAVPQSAPAQSSSSSGKSGGGGSLSIADLLFGSLALISGLLTRRRLIPNSM
jgi:fibronectin type 3 domain-containing protein